MRQLGLYFGCVVCVCVYVRLAADTGSWGERCTYSCVCVCANLLDISDIHVINHFIYVTFTVEDKLSINCLNL